MRLLVDADGYLSRDRWRASPVEIQELGYEKMS
jgi:hypothetical protein